MNKIYKIYTKLYEEYGPQGWWPFINHHGTNNNKVGVTEGYHISDYSFPRNSDEVFEVCLGSILTQNTSFTSVVKSLKNLNDAGCLSAEKIKSMNIDDLKLAIKPSGYHNQKAKYLLCFIDFFLSLNGRTPERNELLEILGIGNETADSMLLYGYNQPQFKIDAYTKRILVNLGIVSEKAKYMEMKEIFEKSLKAEIKDRRELTIVYQEYHALIVNHSKLFYQKKPYGGCFLEGV